MASRLADLERYWGQAMDKYLVKHGIGEDLIMGMAGQPVETGKQPKHYDVLHGIYRLKKVVDQYDWLFTEIAGTTQPPNEQKTPDAPESMSLAHFLASGRDMIMHQVERLEQIYSDMRDALL